MTAQKGKREHGYLLLPVTLTLLVVALTAVLLTQESGHQTRRGGDALEAQRARYVAEAGLNHLTWQLEKKNCAGYSNLASTNFGGTGSYSGTVSASSGSPVSLTATSTLPSGAQYQLSRRDLPVFASTPVVGFLQPDATAGKDGRVEEDKPDHNHGGNKELDVDAKSGARYRSLLEFDLSALRGVQIDAAELALYLYENDGSQSAQIEARRVLRAWSEEDNDTTSWDHARPSVRWNQGGGDFDETVFDSFLASGTGWKTLNLTELVRLWSEGEYPNYGLILLSPDPSFDGKKRFYSSDEGDASLRPKLTIAYRCECGVPCPTLTTPTVKRLLFVVADADELSDQEELKKALFESWDYEVSTIGEAKYFVYV